MVTLCANRGLQVGRLHCSVIGIRQEEQCLLMKWTGTLMSSDECVGRFLVVNNTSGGQRLIELSSFLVVFLIPL